MAHRGRGPWHTEAGGLDRPLQDWSRENEKMKKRDDAKNQGRPEAALKGRVSKTQALSWGYSEAMQRFCAERGYEPTCLTKTPY